MANALPPICDVVKSSTIHMGTFLGTSALTGALIGPGALVGLAAGATSFIVSLPLAIVVIASKYMNPRMAGLILVIASIAAVALFFISPAITVPVVAALGLGTITYGKALLISVLAGVISSIVNYVDKRLFTPRTLLTPLVPPQPTQNPRALLTPLVPTQNLRASA